MSRPKRLALVTAMSFAMHLASATGSPATSDAASHKAHHPMAASTPSTKSKTRVDQQMKQMQAMHEKMMAATTSDERAALMDEQMKSMQSGMPMSGQTHEMMENRRDMMDDDGPPVCAESPDGQVVSVRDWR